MANYEIKRKTYIKFLGGFLNFIQELIKIFQIAEF